MVCIRLVFTILVLLTLTHFTDAAIDTDDCRANGNADCDAGNHEICSDDMTLCICDTGSGYNIGPTTTNSCFLTRNLGETCSANDECELGDGGTGTICSRTCVTRCPGGYICAENSTVAEPCWRGWYCMEENPPQPCPNGTYNGEKGADDIGYCLDCPGGYICVGEGIANYTTEPCPIGFYCINASTEAEPCPPGTYRDEEKAKVVLDCHICSAGTYCPDFNMTHDGIDCPDGSYCPEGARFIRNCAVGYYCTNPDIQLPCPPDFYCPEGSTSPVPCPVVSLDCSSYFFDVNDTCYCTEAADCGNPSALTGYIPGTPDKTTEGGTASVSCDTANGYTGTAADITCQEDGTWTAYSGCSAFCGTPTASTGYIPGTPDTTTEGRTASVSCDSANGYTGTAADITCQGDGTWSAYSGCSASGNGASKIRQSFSFVILSGSLIIVLMYI